MRNGEDTRAGLVRRMGSSARDARLNYRILNISLVLAVMILIGLWDLLYNFEMITG